MGNYKVLAGVLLLSLFLSVTVSVDPANAVATADQGQSGGYPTHYFIFKYQPGGTIQPVSYQRVSLSVPMISLTDAQVAQAFVQPERNMVSLAVRLLDGKGSTIFRDVVSYSPWLRGEFEAATAEQGIDGHLIPVTSPVFVVRLPVMRAEKLIFLDNRQDVLAQFEVADILTHTPQIQAGDYPLVTDKQIITGSPANRVDLVVMGDGYTEAQGDQFLTDAEAVTNQFFGISPLMEYGNYYNLYMLATASPESGSDHPPYIDGCSDYDPTCCSDPAMQSDPLQGQMVDTAFDSRFCAYGIHRLLVADEGKVFEAAGAIPEWDQILLIVNDPTYGGSGGTSLAVISMHSAAVEVAQHEYGHSFANLADEYTSPYPGYPPCSDQPGSYNLCEPNVTDITSREQIKWFPWIEEDTPIPTPNDQAFDGMVGLFEGARYQTTGMYRSGYSCIMRALGEPFCQVPSQTYVLKLYQGGWGDPFSGINLIEPGSTLPVSTTLELIHPASQVFSADLLSPVGGPPLEITWLDNGIPIPGIVAEPYTYTTNADSPGMHEISLHVRDATPLVHSLMDQGELDQQYSWSVNVILPLTVTVIADPDTIYANSVSTATITASVISGTVPVEGLTVTFSTTLGAISPITATTDVSGTATSVLTSGMVPGMAIVSVHAAGLSIDVEVEFVALPRMFLPMVNKP